jgi:hypothetical protein
VSGYVSPPGRSRHRDGRRAQIRGRFANPDAAPSLTIRIRVVAAGRAGKPAWPQAPISRRQKNERGVEKLQSRPE